MFYEFRQNNSGGTFDISPTRGISVLVNVEADSAEEANARAEDIGLYFNGCDSGMDCGCCGDRWVSQYGEGNEVPSYYGEPIESIYFADMTGDNKWAFKWAGENPEGYVHYKNGEVVPYGLRRANEVQ